MCVMYIYVGACGGQKRTEYLLELETQVASYELSNMGTGNWIWVLRKNSKALLTTEESLQPCWVTLSCYIKIRTSETVSSYFDMSS